jgi:hypothetical protein
MVLLVTFFEFLRDFNLVLRILVFISIISFSRRYLGNSKIATFVIALMSFIALFIVWPYVAGFYIVYLILMLGFAGSMVDLIWISSSLREYSVRNAPSVPGPTKPTGIDTIQRGRMMRFGPFSGRGR